MIFKERIHHFKCKIHHFDTKFIIFQQAMCQMHPRIHLCTMCYQVAAGVACVYVVAGPLSSPAFHELDSEKVPPFEIVPDATIASSTLPQLTKFSPK